MAILTSLFSGVSGLNAFGAGLSVISNNIANMNTVGFKGGEVSFSDLISSGQSRAQIGRGVLVNDIRTNFEQGSFETTGSGLDLAIEGEGFFALQDAAGAEFYTRSGTFNVSKNGLVENPEGLLLQGTQANAAGSLNGQPSGPINLANTSFSPVQTSTLAVDANLDSRATTIGGGFNVTNPSGTSNTSTSITMFDSGGVGHLVSIYFTKASATQWTYNAVVPAADTQIGSADTIMANGTLTFGTSGQLTVASSTTFATGGFDFAGNVVQNMQPTFDFGTSTGASGTGLDGITNFGAPSAVLTQTQNGFSAGSLSSVSIDKDGVVTGLFTNGQNRTLAQVTLTRFNNQQGLSKVGDNVYVMSNDSGQPIVGPPNTGGAGRVLSNSLELSNVDLAQQFVKMIEYQRGFQANSRVISTTDDLLQELVNIVR